MNLHAPYRFNQRPDPANVAFLVNAQRTGTLYGSLAESVYTLRRGLADVRTPFKRWSGSQETP